MSEPDFLAREEIVAIQEQQLAKFGGTDGIRDANALDSAIGQPQAVH